MAKKKNHKKPTQEQTSRRPVRRWLVVVKVLSLVVLAGLIIRGIQIQTGLFSPAPAPAETATVQSKTTSTTTSPTPPPLIDDVVTPAQDRFMREKVFADWDRIREHYPIPDLRQRFDRLMRRVQSRDIRLQVSALYKPGRLTVQAEADREIMQPIIRFFAPALIDFYQRLSDKETRDDIMIGMLLHEEYHLDKHVFVPMSGPHPKLEYSMRESDTWWWCCETIYAPMVKQGRLSQLPRSDAIYTALNCYNEARGDKTSWAWLDFCLADPMLQRR